MIFAFLTIVLGWLSSSPGYSGRSNNLSGENYEKTSTTQHGRSVDAHARYGCARGHYGDSASIMETPPAPAAPPATATGTVETVPSDQQASAVPSESIAEVALNLLQSALSMF